MTCARPSSFITLIFVILGVILTFPPVFEVFEKAIHLPGLPGLSEKTPKETSSAASSMKTG